MSSWVVKTQLQSQQLLFFTLQYSIQKQQLDQVLLLSGNCANVVGSQVVQGPSSFQIQKKVPVTTGAFMSSQHRKADVLQQHAQF